MNPDYFQRIHLLKFILICFSSVLLSCREEIVPPFNPAGNVNEPVQQISADSYSFIINAQGISDSLTERIFFNFSNTHLFISLFDYLGGSVELTVFDRTHAIYNSTLRNNFPGTSFKLEGLTPDRIRIFFKNFTGKLQIQIVQDFR